MKFKNLRLRQPAAAALRRITSSQGSLRRRRRARVFACLPSNAASAALPRRPELRVAIAVGERLRSGLAWEWSQVELTQHDWQKQLDDSDAALLLIEIRNGGIAGWDEEPTQALLRWASDAGMTSAAWVTAESAEYDHAEPWIRWVDYVFLSSGREIETWRGRFPDTTFDVLPPAAQPRLHNPVGTGGTAREQAAAVILDDTYALTPDSVAALAFEWVDVWPLDDRSRTMLKTAGLARSGWSRSATNDLPPGLGHYAVVAAMAADSDVAWRLVEAGSTQAGLIVGPASLVHIPESLHDLITVVDNAEDLQRALTAHVWQRELRDRHAIRLARDIYLNHTYGHRIRQLGGTVGIPVDRGSRPVSAVVPTNRPHQLPVVFDNIARQVYNGDGGVELVLVLHGLQLERSDVMAMARDAGIDHLTILQADRSLTLGACMNLGLGAASGDFIAKMDDDNFYGRHYLTDLIAAFDYSGAGIVGKWAHYVWLQSTGAVILRSARSEHQHVRLVQGGSIIMTRDVAETFRFSDIPRAVDTDLLKRAGSAGVIIYAGDRFNYVSIRNSERHTHTWTIADAALMNRAGSVVFYGDPRNHVDI